MLVIIPFLRSVPIVALFQKCHRAYKIYIAGQHAEHAGNLLNGARYLYQRKRQEFFGIYFGNKWFLLVNLSGLSLVHYTDRMFK